MGAPVVIGIIFGALAGAPVVIAAIFCAFAATKMTSKTDEIARNFILFL